MTVSSLGRMVQASGLEVMVKPLTEQSRVSEPSNCWQERNDPSYLTDKNWRKESRSVAHMRATSNTFCCHSGVCLLLILNPVVSRATLKQSPWDSQDKDPGLNSGHKDSTLGVDVRFMEDRMRLSCVCACMCVWRGALCSLSAYVSLCGGRMTTVGVIPSTLCFQMWSVTFCLEHTI